MRNHFCYSSRNEEYEESNISFPGNEEAELAKIPGDGDPPPPHWDLFAVLQKCGHAGVNLAQRNGTH